nr:MAG TPA: hypothetical protein [Siphoviridae sp. ctELO16]
MVIINERGSKMLKLFTSIKGMQKRLGRQAEAPFQCVRSER